MFTNRSLYIPIWGEGRVGCKVGVRKGWPTNTGGASCGVMVKWPILTNSRSRVQGHFQNITYMMRGDDFELLSILEVDTRFYYQLVMRTLIARLSPHLYKHSWNDIALLYTKFATAQASMSTYPVQASISRYTFTVHLPQQRHRLHRHRLHYDSQHHHLF